VLNRNPLLKQQADHLLQFPSEPELALAALLRSDVHSTSPGMVLLYDDSTHTLLSDVVTSPCGGRATVGFVSDTNGIPNHGSGTAHCRSVTESNSHLHLRWRW